MGLGKIKVPQKTITVSDGENFLVRGLSLRDVGVLAQRHHQMLSALFAEVATAQGQSGEFEADSISAKLPDLLGRAPDLVCDIIALAAGDIEDSAVVGVLPIPLQVEALENIFGLTFRTEADLKNVVETVIRGMKSATRQLQAVSN